MFFSLLAVLILMWVIGFGTAMVIGLHRRYVLFTKKFFKWLWELIWSKHKKELLWFVAGIISASIFYI